MLAKRLGPDVREGKRRQFDFIGKLLREVEPELVDAITEATKNSDHSRLQALSVSKVWFGKDGDEGEEDFEQEQEEEVPGFNSVAEENLHCLPLPRAQQG